jgi:hypothetical protein
LDTAGAVIDYVVQTLPSQQADESLCPNEIMNVDQSDLWEQKSHALKTRKFEATETTAKTMSLEAAICGTSIKSGALC